MKIEWSGKREFGPWILPMRWQWRPQGRWVQMNYAGYPPVYGYFLRWGYWWWYFWP